MNILIVEDEPKILEVIESYVRNAGYTPLCAETGSVAIDLFNSNPVDLVLLDLMLPDISGENICHHIRKSGNTPIIMITAKTNEESIIAGLEMGADDYITKPFSPRQLIARIHAIFRRVNQVDSINNIKPFTIDKDKYAILLNHQDIGLTFTEFTLFSILLGRPSKIDTRDELAGQLQNGQYGGYIRSIDSHIKNIRNKISNFSSVDYIKTVRGIGYQIQELENR